MPVPAAGAVLCGGHSERMGRDKALLEIQGEPMFARAARTLAAIADPVALARGDRPLPDLGWEQLTDAAEGEGPLAGLVAALRWSPHELTAVVAADMPYVSTALFTALIAGWAGEDAVVPMTTHGTQPLHAIYARSALSKLEESMASGELGLRSALGALEVSLVDTRAEPRFETNVNSPEDLIGLDDGE